MCAGTIFLYLTFWLDVLRDNLPLPYVLVRIAQGQASSYVLVRYPMNFVWGGESYITFQDGVANYRKADNIKI
jgi:hypothetical protein